MLPLPRLTCHGTNAPDVSRLVSRRVSNGALKSAELPKRMKILSWGETPSLKGDMKVGLNTHASLPAAQAAFGFARIAIDYNHQSVPSSPTYKPDPREHAAYGDPEVIEGDGLYLCNIEWTPSGEKYAREYCDLSPTVAQDANGEITFIHSLALCTQGAVENLTFYSASFLTPKTTPTATQTMDHKKLLCALLGLNPETATDADIQAASEAAVKKNAETLSAEKKEDKPVAKPEGKPDELKTLSARLDAFETREREAGRNALLQRARAEGKVIPLKGEALDKVDLITLSAMIDGLPATVPMDQRTPEKLETHSVSTPSGADEAVRKNLGISAEKWKQHNS